MDINKYIYTLAGIGMAFAFTACSGNEEPNPGGGDDTPIQYDVATDGMTSDFTPGSRHFNTNTVDNINLIAVNKDKRYIDGWLRRSGGTWKTFLDNDTETSKFWPASGLDFYGFKGASMNNITWGNRWRDGQNWSAPTNIYFEVPQRADNDLLYCATLDKTKNTPAVNLNFRHLLSRITFAIKNPNDDMEVYIHNIAIDNLYYKGNYNPMGRSTEVRNQAVSTVNAYGEWTLVTDSKLNHGMNSGASSDLGFRFTGRRDNPENLTYNGQLYEMLVMPQSIAANSDATLCIELTMHDPKTGAYVIGSPGNPVWQRVAIPAITWKQNTQYRYILTLEEKKIDVEILPMPFSVIDFINGGDITPPVE